MNVLTYIESRGGKVRGAGIEALGMGVALAQQSGGSAFALVIGPNAGSIAASLDKYGAAEIYAVDGADFAGYSPEAYREAVVTAKQRCSAEVVVLSATTLGRDLAPVVAAKLKAAFLPDCVDVQLDGGKITVKRPVYAGRCLMTLAANSTPAVLSLRPKAFPVAVGEVGPVKVTPLPVDLTGKVLTKFVEERVESAGKLDVTEADVIVAGGRGLKTAEGFAGVEALAATLKGAVGASRAVVDAGWRPHSEQVGQTGKVVAPTLYIAAGISGAIQHLAGMRSSKVIVAINKDPEAPIFKAADYGIVGDALEVLPALNNAISALG